MVDIFNIEREYFSLNEERGVFDAYLELGEEIYEALNKVTPKKVGVSTYERVLNKYVPKSDTFIGNITITYFTFVGTDCKDNIAGSFVHNFTTNDLHDGKLVNCGITFNEYTNSLGEIDEVYFMTVFSHEMRHGYTYYSILNQNNGHFTNNFLHKKAHVGLSRNKTDAPISKLIGDLVYFLENEEIGCYANETYEYVRAHPEITRSSINTHMNKLHTYQQLNKLKKLLCVYDKYIESDKNRKLIRNELTRVFGNKRNSVQMFRQRIVKTICYINRVFIKTLGKAFDDFDRNDINENKFSLNDLNWILEVIERNKHKDERNFI